MSAYRWLRTEWMEPVARTRPDAYGNAEMAEVQFLRALRNDGQLFAVWAEVGPETTPETMRLRLDIMLDSPALPPSFNDETGEWYSPKVPLDYGKGQGRWVEEP